MLSIEYIRENTDVVRRNMVSRKVDTSNLDKLLDIDSERILIIQKINSLNEERNKIEKEASHNLKLREKGKKLKEERDKLGIQFKKINLEFNTLINWIPNMLSKDVPLGNSEEDNVEIYAWTPKDGELKGDKLGKSDASKKYMPEHISHADNHNFKIKDHLELGKDLDIIDTNQGALVSGSRFVYLKNEAVMLQMAIIDFLSKKLIKEDFMPLIPPLLVKDRVLYGTSHFPADQDQIYAIEKDYIEENNRLYLVGSSEPSNFGYFMDKILDQGELPQYFFAVTTCFRSEAGSWGKDVKGIKRLHQFDKLEMGAISSQKNSNVAFERLLDINKWFWESLEIPYHIILKCSGDSGYYASSKQYDVEAWIPSQQKFIEVGTDTNASDYQARVLNIRYKDDDGKLQFVHTINDTGSAIGRTLIAIMENYQQ
ncbi:serine--tRNA ligase, partial [Patescibacteria group bacterium]|nr:serine--tRNA ligase [Patescibacteria group bacterium]